MSKLIHHLQLVGFASFSRVFSFICVSRSYELVCQIEVGLSQFYGAGGSNISHVQALQTVFIFSPFYHGLVINILIFLG